MPAAAIAATSLKPAVPLLLSRCFHRCYSAVPRLFLALPQALKMKINQWIDEVLAQFPIQNSKLLRRWDRFFWTLISI